MLTQITEWKDLTILTLTTKTGSCTIHSYVFRIIIVILVKLGVNWKGIVVCLGDCYRPPFQWIAPWRRGVFGCLDNTIDGVVDKGKDEDGCLLSVSLSKLSPEKPV